jgi:hypothetical protein
MIWLAGLFLAAHGLVHLGIWCSPFDPAKAPFGPRRSWLADRAYDLYRAAGRERIARLCLPALERAREVLALSPIPAQPPI